jgi:hypothetical protein
MKDKIKHIIHKTFNIKKSGEQKREIFFLE